MTSLLPPDLLNFLCSPQCFAGVVLVLTVAVVFFLGYAYINSEKKGRK